MLRSYSLLHWECFYRNITISSVEKCSYLSYYIIFHDYIQIGPNLANAIFILITKVKAEFQSKRQYFIEQINKDIRQDSVQNICLKGEKFGLKQNYTFLLLNLFFNGTRCFIVLEKTSR